MLAVPTHCGEEIRSHSVKEMTNEAIIGPTVQRMKPRIHGEAKSQPSIVRWRDKRLLRGRDLGCVFVETDFAIDATVPFLGHEWQHLLRCVLPVLQLICEGGAREDGIPIVENCQTVKF